MTTTSNSSVDISFIKDNILKAINTSFGSTLGKEPDIVNIFNALIYYESRYKYEAVSPPNPIRKGTAGFSFVNSSAIKTLLETGTLQQKSNILKSVSAIGLTQVLAFYFMKGSSPSGVCEILRLRPDLAGPLTVVPGADPFSIILGKNNMYNSILAGLVILEGKYRAVRSNSGVFTVVGDNYNRVFPSKISAAVAAYLGLGAKDINGTTPESYSASIVGGSTYAIANGKKPVKINDGTSNVASSTGPSTNGSNQANISVPGCQA